jgi:hypothetical protein
MNYFWRVACILTGTFLIGFFLYGMVYWALT